MLKKITAAALMALFSLYASAQNYFTMDMVHHNPGDTLTRSRFLDPTYLKSYGYDAKVFFLSQAPQLGVTWDDFDKTIFPAGSKERTWVDNKNTQLQAMYSEAKNKGIGVFCAMDMLVLPTSLYNKYRDSICSQANDKSYKIDITKPYTQKIFRYLLKQIFDKYPQIDGLVIRTGETYVQDAPYHKGNNPVYDNLFDNHTALINILRDEVCVKRSKVVVYRTWDFGQFRSLPKYYLQVTDKVEPHGRLFFGIKHTNVDYWRNGISNPAFNYTGVNQYWINQSNDNGVYFNPTLGIGKHKQIVEVQCQREYEGKASHPNYIAKGVIDGFTELKKPGLPTLNSLNELKKSPLLAGVWTWSRGGGWGGPKIPSELWADLNAYVITQWAKSPNKSEEAIFSDYARLKGLPDSEIAKFHELALLSDEGVMKGQYSTMGKTSIAWTRDNNFSGNLDGFSYLGSGFDKVIKDNKVEEYLAEKAEAVEIWKKIEALSKELHFKDDATSSFVRVSCTYGRLKYETFKNAWCVMLRGYAGKKPGKTIDQVQMGKDILAYDKSFAAWKKWVADNPNSASMYSSSGFDPTINQYRGAAISTDGLKGYKVTPAGKKIKLDFSTILEAHDHIDIVHKTDSTEWEVIATLPGNTFANPKTDFKVNINTPQNGINYYAIRLYDPNKKLFIPHWVSFDVKANAVINSFNAVLTGNQVKINFTSSSESTNAGFAIARRTDGKTWTLLTLVEGGGTTTTQQNYEAYDKVPVTGINDYVLVYYANGVQKYSSMRTINVTPPLAAAAIKNGVTFDVYPNPSTSAIAFDLKGYKGKNITATVSNLLGKTIGTETLSVNPNERYTLSSKPAAGTYILRINGNGINQSGKVILK